MGLRNAAAADRLPGTIPKTDPDVAARAAPAAGPELLALDPGQPPDDRSTGEPVVREHLEIDVADVCRIIR